MPVFRVPDSLWFPDPAQAHASGIVGVGGDLSTDRLWLAYQRGIFPWFGEDNPILWWSPDPRMVLYPSELHIGRSLRKRLRRGDLHITMDEAFGRVLDACASVPRPGQTGTWLVPALRRGLLGLHARGHAHSVEAWDVHGKLVGGLYGIQVGSTFCGESMFANTADASKVAFVVAVEQLAAWGTTQIDCQVHTEHLARFGAREVPRVAYLRELARGREEGPPVGLWRLEPARDPAARAYSSPSA